MVLLVLFPAFGEPSLLEIIAEGDVQLNDLIDARGVDTTITSNTGSINTDIIITHANGDGGDQILSAPMGSITTGDLDASSLITGTGGDIIIDTPGAVNATSITSEASRRYGWQCFDWY
jgi:hypothetical protein